MTRWLEPDERSAWLGMLSSIALLDDALDQQLQQDAGITHGTYAILVGLSEAPDRTLHMSKLSVMTNSSPSRLSHAVSRLERDGLLVRSPCPTNRRAVHATLTDRGFAVVEAAAPGHVETVRSYVFDQLTTDQVQQLSTITSAILSALDKAGHSVPDFLHGS